MASEKAKGTAGTKKEPKPTLVEAKDRAEKFVRRFRKLVRKGAFDVSDGDLWTLRMLDSAAARFEAAVEDAFSGAVEEDERDGDR